MVSDAAYTAWGSVNSPAAIATPFAWKGQSGQYTDSETSLVYCNARYYSPAIGRFLSRDPIVFAGGINVYGYCGGDPVNYADPSGLSGQLELQLSEAAHVAAPYAASAVESTVAVGGMASVATAGHTLAATAGTSVAGIGMTAIPAVVLTGGLGIIAVEGVGIVGCYASMAHDRIVTEECAQPINLASLPNSVARIAQRSNRCSINAQILRGNLLAAGEVAQEGDAAHHIAGSTHKLAAPARAILTRDGIDINDPDNGIFLPHSRKIYAVGTTYHADTYSHSFIRAVNNELRASAPGTARTVLNDIKLRIRIGQFP